MTRPSRSFTKLALALSITVGGASHASTDAGAFSFAYTFERDRSITPFQVFDDGNSTFLQYRDKSKIPTFLIRDTNGTRVLTPQEDGPYLRLDAVAARIELIGADGKTAAIVSINRPESKSVSVATSPVAPTLARATTLAPPTKPSQITSESTARSVPPIMTTVQPPPPAIACAPAPNRAQQSMPVAVFNRQALAPVLTPQAQTAYEPSEVQVLAPKTPEATQVEQIRQQMAPIAQMLLAMKTKLDALAGVGASEPATALPVSATLVDPPNAVVAAPTTVRAIPVAYMPQPVAKSFSFQVADGQRLSDAVRRFITTHDLVLDWDTGGADYEIRFGYTVTGASIDAVLLNVLSPFKLNAITRRGNGVVAVTRAT